MTDDRETPSSPDSEVNTVDTLGQHEAIISDGLRSFISVGNALIAIQAGKLFREVAGSFEDYLRSRFPHLERRRAYQLMQAAEVANRLTEKKITQPNEAQARELSRFAVEHQAVIWQQALDSGQKMTARLLKQLGAAFTDQEQPLPQRQRRSRVLRIPLSESFQKNYTALMAYWECADDQQFMSRLSAELDYIAESAALDISLDDPVVEIESDTATYIFPDMSLNGLETLDWLSNQNQIQNQILMKLVDQPFPPDRRYLHPDDL